MKKTLVLFSGGKDSFYLTKIFDKLFLEKAKQLIEKYSNNIYSGDYL